MNSIPAIAAGIALTFSIGIAYGDANHAKKGPHADARGSSLGKPGDPKKVTRTIEVAMGDTMRFSPAKIAVRSGETIRFVVKNDGKLKHEMVLGTVKELKEHAALMQKFPEMEHADPNQVTVDPGKTGEMIWQFSRTGKVDFACLQPGHYEAGMAGKVTVAGTAVKPPGAAAK